MLPSARTAAILSVLKRELAGGGSPEKLALAVALGAVCGLFPIYGTTTAVTAVAGLLFRANPIVVQVCNYAMYPIYFFVEFALIAVGAWLFEGDLHAYTLDGLRSLAAAGPWAMVSQGARALGQALLVWAALAWPAVIGLRQLFLYAFSRWPSLMGGHPRE
jgi:uncharacterized protein (DUF2062 family)